MFNENVKKHNFVGGSLVINTAYSFKSATGENVSLSPSVKANLGGKYPARIPVELIELLWELKNDSFLNEVIRQSKDLAKAGSAPKSAIPTKKP